MRRVNLNEDGSCTYDSGEKSDGTSTGNYVSFTVWEKKSHFSAWRTGEAFKEAHGGASLGAFVSTMVNSALVLQGPPRPAFYDGLIVQSTIPTTMPKLVDGWRDIEADGKTILPNECFVACNQFYVSSENGPMFEKRWADRESKLKECEGFVGFSLLRRDGQVKGHGVAPVNTDEPTYLSTTVWKDRKSFDSWRTGSAFIQAHSGNKPTETEKGGKEKKPKMLWSKPPTPVFYEGILVITQDQGI